MDVVGLLAAAIIAGADPRKCYGIELDPKIVKICKKRLKKLGVPSVNIKVGNALKEESYNFKQQFQLYNLLQIQIKKLNIYTLTIIIYIYLKNHKFYKKVWVINILDNKQLLLKQLYEIYQILNTINDKEKEIYLCTENLEKRLKFLKYCFKTYLNLDFQYEKEHLIELN